jgi:poly(beta-D-mannuronate) lyase
VSAPRLAGIAGLCAALAACAATTSAVSGTALAPPPGFTAAVQADGGDAGDCGAPPRPYTGTLEFTSKYEGSDKARDDFNPKAAAQYEAQIADVRELEKQVSSKVSRYLHNGRPETLDCVLGMLDAWAQAGALLGESGNHTGKSVRKWALASVASAWLRLKFSVSQPLAKEAGRAGRIEAWFGKLGDLVVRDWRNQPLEKMNNHEYWAAWAMMATAVALDRRDFYDWAMEQYGIAITQIDGEGYLPNELKRDTRALAYHNYALNPLAMIAAFAKANGTDLEESRPAMQRLAGKVLAGVDNPKIFEKKTGEKQTREGVHEPSKFAWMEPYCWTFSCDAEVTRRLDKMRPLKTQRMGGNVTELFAATRPATGRKATSRAGAP